MLNLPFFKNFVKLNLNLENTRKGVIFFIQTNSFDKMFMLPGRPLLYGYPYPYPCEYEYDYNNSTSSDDNDDDDVIDLANYPSIIFAPQQPLSSGDYGVFADYITPIYNTTQEAQYPQLGVDPLMIPGARILSDVVEFLHEEEVLRCLFENEF